MNLTPFEQKVFSVIKYKTSNIQAATKLNMSVDEYVALKQSILGKVREAQTKTAFQVSTPAISETQFDVDKGTGTIKGVMSREPLSPEEVEIEFKIDKSKWRLSSYWNKRQPNGTYLVSANITQLKPGQIDARDVLDSIKKVFSDKYPSQIFGNLPANKRALFVYTSDKHIGAHVSEEALYANDYNEGSVARRMTLLLEEINYHVSTYGRFEDIFIIDLGDSMDGLNGQTTRGGHSLPQNLSNKQAFEAYLRTHKDFFDTLICSNVANNIHSVNAVMDNHGGDFAYFTSRALEEYMNVRYPKVKTRVLNKFIEHLEYGNHTFVLTHGKDDEDLKHGLPLHLNDKTENYLNKYLNYHRIDPILTQIHIRKGDLHSYSNQLSYNYDYKNVLSMFGGSKWVGTNFGPTHPGVCMEVVEKHGKRIYETNLIYK